MSEEFLDELHKISHDDDWRYKLLMQGVKQTLATRKSESALKRYIRRKSKHITAIWK